MFVLIYTSICTIPVDVILVCGTFASPQAMGFAADMGSNRLVFSWYSIMMYLFSTANASQRRSMPHRSKTVQKIR